MLRSLFSQFFSRRRPSPDRAQVPAPATSAIDEARRLLATRSFDEADAAAGAVLAKEPENADALVIRAEILRRRGQLQPAMKAYRHALVLNPRHVEAWLDLGVCHYLLGDYFWARFYFRLANTLDPDRADVWNELGLVEIILGNYEKAEDSLEKAVNRMPDHAEAWNNLGLVVARRGELVGARRNFLRATFLKPDFYMAYCNLGLACRDLELLDEAERALRRAAELRPGQHTAWLNLGVVLQDQGRLDEALQAIEQAHAVAPKDADVIAALSTLWLRRGDAARAIECAEQGLAQDPGNAEARLALAHAQLALQRFEQGWPNYEARLRSSSSPLGPLPVPLCDADNLAGKTVLVEREQGLGDEIMFASCLNEFAGSGVNCVIHCDPRLVVLFRRSFPQSEVVGRLGELEAPDGSLRRAIDCCVPMGSLPGRYRRTRSDFARATAFLRADPERAARWRARLAALGPGPKVGIAWRGGLYKTGRALRSLSLESLLPVLRVPGVGWVNLQHRDHARELEQIHVHHGVQVARWDDALADLDETAALVHGLDLVITVCSTVVHLAGALGRPVWTLTPHAPAWRYLFEGDSMPWYPNVRLFRQRAEGDWDEVISRVAAALGALCTEAA
jgi:tetratricopeptide (TPR) repeat protein